MCQDFPISVRGASELLQFPRSSHYYRSRKDSQVALRMRLKELAASRPRFGYRRLLILLRREGWSVGHKLIYRLYCEENLQVRTRRRRRRKITSQPRLALPKATRPGQRWAMDFVADQLLNGTRWRALNVIDQCSRECIVLEAAGSIGSQMVCDLLDRAILRHGKPESITCDNGTEFTSRCFDAWAYSRGIHLDFIGPGKPAENGFIESFNGRLREECLSQHWFLDIDEVQECLAAWKKDYNETWPHTSLGGLAPAEYVGRLLAQVAR